MNGLQVTVLSLFDGMSGTRLALEKAGIKVDKYYSSEIDRYAISVADKNYPQDTQYRLGDIYSIDPTTLPQIDLVVFGFPCQSYSQAGKRAGLESKNGNLIYEVFRLLEVLKPNYILGENVKGLLSIDKGKTFEFIMSELRVMYPDVQHTIINSALVSAQNRVRVYISNFDISQPEDKELVLADILEEDYIGDDVKDTDRNKRHYREDDKKSLTCTATMYKGAGNNGMTLVPNIQRPCKLKEYNEESQCHHVATATDIKGNESIKRVYADSGKAPTVTTMQGGHREPKVLCTPTTYRILTVLECERLQTIKDNYTLKGIDATGKEVTVSNTQRKKMLGNGFTIDVIVHILKGLKWVNQ